MVAAMLTSIGSHAQANIDKALEQLKQHAKIEQTKKVTTYDPNEHETNMQLYHFSFGPNNMKWINNMRNALEGDADKAYFYSVQSGKNGQITSYNIYGEGSSSTIFGRGINIGNKLVKPDQFIISCIMDPNDSTNSYRFCYALEWVKAKDGKIVGRVGKAYELRPSKKQKKTGIKVNIDGIDLDVDKLSNFSWDSDFPFDSIANSNTISKLITNDDGTIIIDSGINSHTKKDNDVSWLTSFNFYRNKLQSAFDRKKTTSASTTSYAIMLMKLCAKAKDVKISDRIIKNCARSVVKLRALAQDEIIASVLDEAIDELRKN